MLAKLTIEQEVGEPGSPNGGTPSVEGTPSVWRKLVTWQSIAAAIAGLTLVVVALRGLLVEIPSTVESYEKARSALTIVTSKSMLPHPSPEAGMRGAGIQSSDSGSSATKSAVQDSDLGPRPGPGCHVFVSTDYGVYPAKVARSWQC